MERRRLVCILESDGGPRRQYARHGRASQRLAHQKAGKMPALHVFVVSSFRIDAVLLFISL
ncbi:MAG: hypothetical protein C5B54_06560 [Acidobacteria bacterium]|nr:MAG: hypothetical protein C5B54_06560 [Acidobacteriota bacterium]